MKIIIYRDDENCLVVCCPCYDDNSNDEQKYEFLLYVQNKDVPRLPDGSIRPSWILESEDVKKVIFLRNAWSVDDNGNLIFLRNKAEEIKKDQFRFFRKSLFAELDFHFMKALEENDSAKLLEVKNKKQILRDITTIDMSQYDTPEKLHKFIPDVLKPAV
jgi:hypothetical protein